MQGGGWSERLFEREDGVFVVAVPTFPLVKCLLNDSLCNGRGVLFSP